MTRPECGYDWDELFELSDGFYQAFLVIRIFCKDNKL